MSKLQQSNPKAMLTRFSVIEKADNGRLSSKTSYAEPETVALSSSFVAPFEMVVQPSTQSQEKAASVRLEAVGQAVILTKDVYAYLASNADILATDLPSWALGLEHWLSGTNPVRHIFYRFHQHPVQSDVFWRPIADTLP